MKKKLMAVALATIIAVMAVAGASLAWLKDTTAPVVNTFTEGKVDITLKETPVGENGSATGNTYKMVPGDVLPKDPMVTVVAESEACWLFVKIEEINAVDTFLSYDYIKGDDGWKLYNESANTIILYREVSATDAANGISYYILDGNKVTVKESVEMSDMNTLNASTYPQLKFTAYAIQSANIANLDTAWAQAQTAQQQGN